MCSKKRKLRSSFGRSSIISNFSNPGPADESWQAWVDFVHIQYKKDRIDSMFNSVNNDPRPYLKVKIFDVDFIGLLDSGATQTIIGNLGWNKLKKFNLDIENYYHTVRVANGQTCNVSGVVNVPIVLDSKLKVIRCLVVLDIAVEIIFGIDFWRDMDITSNFAKNSWEFGDRGVDKSGVCSLDVGDEDKRRRLNDMVSSYFNRMGSGLGCAKGVKHKIETDGSQPIKQRYYNVSPYLQKIINEEIDDMLKLGVVEPSNSAWSSPVVMVKKASGDYRFCVDFRKVNAVTRKDAYPLPYVNSILDRLRGARYLSSIDVKSAYWQIELEDGSKDKTAFTVPGRGLYQFKRMPFGLHNSAATWQRFVEKVLGAELETSVFVYLDDIIVISPDFETHMNILGRVLEKLLNAGLTLNREKCHFMKDELKYLGFLVNKDGLNTDPAKVECMLNYPVPKRVKDVRRLVGMVSWYRRFIPNFATRIAPLTKLTRKNVTFSWGPECDRAFNDIKRCLISAPILTCPDYSKQFILQCDASQIGLGCVLVQNFEDGEKVISYASRALTAQEAKYSTTELECLALLFGIEKYRAYFEGTRFKVVTDHYSLLWLYKLQNPSGRLARWALRLQSYDFEIVHRKGEAHVVPDALSRAVCYVDVPPNESDKWYNRLKRNILSCPNKYPKFKVRNEKVYKFVNYGHPSYDEEDDWKLVIPKSLRQQVCRENHDEAHAGHLGIFKSQKRIAQRYYWPGMHADITRYVRSCDICKAQKPDQRLSHGKMSVRRVSRPWELVCSDLVGPLPISRSKNRYILVVADCFTKYALLFPLKSATSSAIIKHVENDVFLMYGVPERLICDNGKQYVSIAFKKMVRSYGCEIVFNANYSPHVNPTERINRVIGTMIRSYVDSDQRDWDVNLAKIGFALRTSVHEITGYSPAYLNFGREPHISGKMHAVDNPDGTLEFDDRHQLSEHLKSLRGIQDQVKGRLVKAYQDSAERYNLRRRPISLKVGQVVWKKNYTLSNKAEYYAAKLAPKFIKCTVARKISTNVYELRDFNTRKSFGYVHIKDIKLD